MSTIRLGAPPRARRARARARLTTSPKLSSPSSLVTSGNGNPRFRLSRAHAFRDVRAASPDKPGSTRRIAAAPPNGRSDCRIVFNSVSLAARSIFELDLLAQRPISNNATLRSTPRGARSRATQTRRRRVQQTAGQSDGRFINVRPLGGRRACAMERRRYRVGEMARQSGPASRARRSARATWGSGRYRRRAPRISLPRRSGRRQPQRIAAAGVRRRVTGRVDGAAVLRNFIKRTRQRGRRGGIG